MLSSQERRVNMEAVSEEMGASDAVDEMWRQRAEQPLRLERAACANIAWR